MLPLWLWLVYQRLLQMILRGFEVLCCVWLSAHAGKLYVTRWILGKRCEFYLKRTSCDNWNGCLPGGNNSRSGVRLLHQGRDAPPCFPRHRLKFEFPRQAGKRVWVQRGDETWLWGCGSINGDLSLLKPNVTVNDLICVLWHFSSFSPNDVELQFLLWSPLRKGMLLANVTRQRLWQKSVNLERS